LPQKFSKICQSDQYDGQQGHIDYINPAVKHPRDDNGKNKADDRSDDRSDYKNLPLAH
jgi:hypothetical protein